MPLFRSLLLWLSRQRRLGDALERIPPGQRLVSRFVAGRTHEGAIATAKPLLARGFSVTFSALGEDIVREAQSRAAVREYGALLAAVREAGIAAQTTVAVKPSLLGLALGQELALANLRQVATTAAAAGSGLELDMERSGTVAATLALYRAARPSHAGLGVAIQASLKRSAADLQALIDEGIAHVRIVKGAYADRPEVAHTDATAIDSAFHQLVRMALDPTAMRGGAFLAIGTHDEQIIASTRTRAFRKRTPPDRWEVQMLFGVRPRLQERLRREGYPVRIYLPYGPQWYAYFVRRLAERPANFSFALRQLVQR